MMETRNQKPETRSQNIALVRAPCMLLLMMTVLLGGVYPLLVTAVAQIIFHDKANGSLIMRDNKVIGSELLGQHFTDPKYFWGRPSATTPPYNAGASSASNMNPGNPALLAAVKERMAMLQKYDPKNNAPIAVDLLTASGSGLDPDISLAAAQYQSARVAKYRHKTMQDIQVLIEKHTQSDVFSGQKRVNVLKLNLALDEYLKASDK